ncbi:hypothetical protein [Bacillus piscicola]|uniref:hypothetical protein n=1 Tax=Bacillus piscicola TaxID=1632684 RepID=UPI001F097AC4|nr:hypothetical protein [Bacillus piscicola]
MMKDTPYPVTFVPLPYVNVEETTNIIKQNSHLVDVWVFTGVVPYVRAEETTDSSLLFYLPIDHSSVKAAMIKMSYIHHMNLERVSFDTIRMDVLNDIYLDLGLATDQIFSYEITDKVRETAEIVDFHEGLYRKRQVDSCVTSIKSVYDRLKEKRIPVFRVMPSKQIINETIHTAYLSFQAKQFKQSQIAIMHINLAEFEVHTSDLKNSYDVYRLNLKIREQILNFSESIFGTYHLADVGKFLILSTRESFQTFGEMGHTLLRQITSLTKLNVYIGIGYGDTALSANNKAALALHYAENYARSCIFIGDELGSIEGPLDKADSISFSFRTDDQEMMDKLGKAGVSVASYNKILSVQDKTEGNSVTAAQLATWLNMTQRNARRILTGLMKEGLAEIIGEELPTSKGRPRKIFRIH